jgi:Na+-driven multidrug efflux pump
LILLLASSFYHLKSVLSEGLRGLKYPEATAYAEIASLVITVVALVILLPKIGILGAAIASLKAYSLSVTILITFTLRKTPIQIKTLFVVNYQDLQQVKQNILHWIHKDNKISLD